MPNPAPNRLPAIPLSIWVQGRLERLAREHEGATRVLAEQLGISERQVYCWERQENSDGEPVFNFKAETVEDALARGEIGMWEVFPGFELGIADISREGFCTACDEVVGATSKGRCVWCDGPIVRAETRAERIVRRNKICPKCRGPKWEKSLRCNTCARAEMESGHEGWFTTRGAAICPSCSGRKSRDAKLCRGCWVAGGGPKGRRQLKSNELVAISADVLAEARRLYETPMAMSEVAARIIDRTSYAHETSCSQSLLIAFRRRGWPIRSRSEANRLKARAPEAIAA